VALSWELAVVYVNIVIFWDVTSCNSVYRYHILKEPADSLFKVEGYFYSEVGGDRFLPNVVPPTRLHGVTSQATTVLVITVMRTSDLR
jgi:hypothetical protein